MRALFDENMTVTECDAAHITLEGLLFSVFAHVYGEYRSSGTIFVAVRASMLGDAAVHCHLMVPNILV